MYSANLTQQLEEEGIGCFVPDILLSEDSLGGGCSLKNRNMPYHRFTALLRRVLMEPPLSLDSVEALKMSTYSLRRFLPSAGDALA